MVYCRPQAPLPNPLRRFFLAEWYFVTKLGPQVNLFPVPFLVLTAAAEVCVWGGGRLPLYRRGCRRPPRRYVPTAVAHVGRSSYRRSTTVGYRGARLPLADTILPWVMAVGCATAVAHDDRRGTRRLTVESDKFSNGRIILQNDLKNIKKNLILSSPACI
jgi:hypothetical protein